MDNGEGEKEKKERSLAARKFSRCQNRLNETIQAKGNGDSILGKLKDLTVLLKNLQYAHDSYLFALSPDKEEPEEEEIQWLRKYEERFDIIENATSDYLHACELKIQEKEKERRKQSKDTEVCESVTYAKQKRDSMKFIFTQELNGIQDFMKMDAEGLLKSQVISSMNGAKAHSLTSAKMLM